MPLIIIQLFWSCSSLSLLCFLCKHVQTIVIFNVYITEQWFTNDPAHISYCFLNSAIESFFFLFTAMRCHWREGENKLWSACSVISLAHLSLTQHRSLSERFVRAISCTAACLCLVQKNYSPWFRLFAVLNVWWAMVDGLCSFSSLCSASLWLKQNYIFCREDLSIDAVTCPLQSQGIFATAIPWN